MLKKKRIFFKYSSNILSRTDNHGRDKGRSPLNKYRLEKRIYVNLCPPFIMQKQQRDYRLERGKR